jgi:hypothetical protein
MRSQNVHQVESVSQVAGYTEKEMATKEVSLGQIIEELKAVRDAFEWRLTERERIQGSLKNDVTGRVFDPVTAVAFLRSGVYYPEGHTAAAARDLGLSFLDCTEITTACTYGCTVPTTLGDLRGELIRAVFPESALKPITLTFGVGQR